MQEETRHARSPAPRLFAGVRPACAEIVLFVQNSIICAGDNSYGQLGRGNTENIGVSCGRLMRKNSQKKYLIFFLGDDSGEMPPEPIDVRNMQPITASVGPNHVCAVLMNGFLMCWGKCFRSSGYNRCVLVVLFFFCSCGCPHIRITLIPLYSDSG